MKPVPVFHISDHSYQVTTTGPGYHRVIFHKNFLLSPHIIRSHGCMLEVIQHLRLKWLSSNIPCYLLPPYWTCRLTYLVFPHQLQPELGPRRMLSRVPFISTPAISDPLEIANIILKLKRNFQINLFDQYKCNLCSIVHTWPFHSQTILIPRRPRVSILTSR